MLLQPNPLTLSFDTSAAHCAVALVSGDVVLGTQSESLLKGQAERLIPMIEEVLEGASKRWSDIDLIAVGTGPGNFTGVRIAVSAARGLALSLEVPAIGVSVFEALAFGTKGHIQITRDGRRGMVLSQDFVDGKPSGEPEMRPLAEGEVLNADAVVDPIKIAYCAALKEAGAPPAPLYLRSADAALPSDPPPRILP